MLFAITWVPTSGVTEERDKRSLSLFSKWQPPAEVQFKGFYDYADGTGGVAIVETASAEALLEATAPWAAFFHFTARPLVESEKAAALYAKAIAWRDSVK